MGLEQRRHIIVVALHHPCQVARRRFLRSLSCVAVPLVVGPVLQVGAKRLHTLEPEQAVVAYRLEAASRKAHGQRLCCFVAQGACMGLLLDH